MFGLEAKLSKVNLITFKLSSYLQGDRGKRLLLFLKIIITVFILFWIIKAVSWKELWHLLRNSNPYLIVLVIFLRFLSLPLSAYKWKKLLEISGILYSLRQLQKWYLAGMFLSNFLPTSIGGDGYRLYKTFNNPAGRSYAVLAIFIERLTGFGALLVLGYGAIAFKFITDPDPLTKLMFTIFTIGAGTVAIFSFIVFKLEFLEKFKKSRFCPDKLENLINNINTYYQSKWVLTKVIIVSFVFHVNRVLSIWLIIYALGVSADTIVLTVVVAITQIIGLLPISLNGIGIVDGSFIYLMNFYGTDIEVGLSTMLLSRTLLIPMILVGAVCYMSDQKNRKKDQQ